MQCCLSCWVAVACVLGSTGSARAALELCPLFSDHTVLQRDAPLPVWGWADPGEGIAVTIDGRTVDGMADGSGKWMVRLPALATAAPRTMTVRGKSESLEVRDILVGEVWICSGQSNMEWPLSATEHAKVDVATADQPSLRFFQVGNPVTPDGPTDRLKPSDRAKCVWEQCTAETASRFSAAAYYFGRELQKKLGVPVGLIHNAVGATPIEAWISREALKADPTAKYVVERAERVEKYAETPKGKEELTALFAEYDARQKEARAKGGWFWRSDDYQEPRCQLKNPGTFFNGRVAPLIPFAIRGAIWYQGEANWDMGHAYRTLFPLLIQDWRTRWGQGDFPFLYVQLPNFGPPAAEPEAAPWAELRESQLLALRVKNTAMAVAIDLGDARDIHPKNKRDVGGRLALAALGTVYGKTVVYSGPIYRDMTVEGAVVRIAFDHRGGGLVAKEGELKRFMIAGSDRKFVAATATIDGDSVLVHSDAVAEPKAVRYAWASNPEGCNLYNREGLPASPFRTDDWPGATTGKTYRDQLDKPISFPIPKR